MGDDDADPRRSDSDSRRPGADSSVDSTVEPGNDPEPLAVVVDKPRSEAAIESLRAECVYDDSRRVREYDVDTVALPVTDPPAETRVREVIRQVDPESRNRGLEGRLADRGWSDADLESAPKSWAVIGDVIVVRVPEGCPDEGELGETLLEVQGAESVLADEGVANDGTAGTHREPRRRLLAGRRDTETIHTEHGTRYALDPARVLFSPGNQAERARMGEVVEPDERVFDMFAGIGYFTLPMARAGATVTATEVNPASFRYLLENAVLNDVADRVDAYRADCRDLAGEVEADRVVMGYYGSADGIDAEGHGTRREEAQEFLPDALSSLVSGGILHYHEATPDSRLWERPLERLESAVDEAERTFEVLETRRVKSHSAGVSHVVVDVQVE
ncbi:class I SAM-dependent methyltransferase [Natronobeatus ordinarius]|uniref:class I SAM-dependent methyltransferase n=1 Tax=Natronobeatus ordinarius TaxID=2963433 RepID=UPI0020CD179F|nr:class I SAM-dependent methyltransferase family protein [Natronobeatus ordinarius]